MLNNTNISTSKTETADTETMQTRTTGMTSDAIVRRRLLLKSLGKGSSVIAAAAIPMHTLAATGTLSKTATGMRCTISGNQSAIHSQTPTSDICIGYSPDYYKKPEHWPNFNPTTAIATNTVGNKVFTQKSTFTEVFGGSSSVGSSTLIYIMNNYSDNEAFHWITALLNSLPGSPASNFPYFGPQIIDFYIAPDPLHSNALKFFKDYMEVHT